jgi:hypothetical protein
MVDHLSGAGPAESLYELGQSFGAADGDSMVLNGVAVGLDLLGALANPIDTLGSSVIGWIIDHIAILRAPLDFTVGNPDVVQNAVQQWNDTAINLDEIADRQKAALGKEIPTYVNGGSSSVPAFTEAMGQRELQIRGAGMTCTEIAELTAQAGTWIAGIRGVIRDMIAGFVWDLLEKAVAKFAFAPLTFGATAAEFLADTMIRVSNLVRRIAGKLDELVGSLKLISGNLKKLADRLDTLLTPKITPGELVDVLDGALPAVPKLGLDVAREKAKVSTTQTATTDEADAQKAKDKHGTLVDDGYQQREKVRERWRGEPGPYETEDWWTKRGDLYS